MHFEMKEKIDRYVMSCLDVLKILHDANTKYRREKQINTTNSEEVKENEEKIQVGGPQYGEQIPFQKFYNRTWVTQKVL